MDKIINKDYTCIDCKTKRYLIYPNYDETFVICSACFRIRREKEEDNVKK